MSVGICRTPQSAQTLIVLINPDVQGCRAFHTSKHCTSRQEKLQALCSVKRLETISVFWLYINKIYLNIKMYFIYIYIIYIYILKHHHLNDELSLTGGKFKNSASNREQSQWRWAQNTNTGLTENNDSSLNRLL